MGTIVLQFILIHFIVGFIRGFYRYLMIERCQYNYYHHSMKFLGRLAHNWLYSTFNSTTLLISVCLTILVFIISIA